MTIKKLKTIKKGGQDEYRNGESLDARPSTPADPVILNK